MNFHWKSLILLTCAAFLSVSCGPQKQEETPAPEQKTEAPATDMKKLQAPPAQGQQQGTPLTPEQKEELKIDEDNVMNPFPG